MAEVESWGIGRPDFSNSVAKGANEAYVWDSGGITSVQASHWRIKESKEWFVSHRFVDVVDDGEAVLHIKAASTKAPHGYISVHAGGKCYVDTYENPVTTDDGTALTGVNMNRQTIIGTPTASIFHTPTKTNDGTIMEYGLLGAAGKFTAAGGVETGGYWLLKPNEEYLVIVTNKSGAAVDIVIQYGWHEHPV